MKLHHLLFFLIIVFFTFNCKKDEFSTAGLFEQNATISKENIVVRVVNSKNEPISMQEVLIGDNYARTDFNGLAFFKNIDILSSGTLVQTKDAYPNYRAFKRIFPNQKMITLTLLEQPTYKDAYKIDAAKGGTISNSAEGWSITFPPNAFMDKTINTLITSGDIYARVKYLDPTKLETFDVMPGDLRAYRENGVPCILGTFGMISVDLSDNSANPAQLRKDVKATITMPIAKTQLNDAPKTIPQWFFDEKDGVWREEGEAQKKNDKYEMNVGHFTTWNVDFPFNAIYLEGKIVDKNGKGLSGLSLRVSDVSNAVLFIGTNTQADGYFKLLVPKDADMKLQIASHDYNCGIISKQEINPLGKFSQDKNLGDIVYSQAIPTQVHFKVKGQLVDCNGNGVMGIINNYKITSNDGFFTFDYCKNSNFLPNALHCIDYNTGKYIEQMIDLSSKNDIDLGKINICNAKILNDGEVWVNISDNKKVKLENVNFITLNNGFYINAWKTPSNDTTAYAEIAFYNQNPNDKIGKDARLIHISSGIQFKSTHINYYYKKLAKDSILFSKYDPANKEFIGDFQYTSRQSAIFSGSFNIKK